MAKTKSKTTTTKHDKKYEETKYRATKIDTSDITLSIGTELYLNNKLYGVIVDESKNLYYIHNEDTKIRYLSLGIKYEPEEFRKVALKEKIAQGLLEIK